MKTLAKCVLCAPVHDDGRPSCARGNLAKMHTHAYFVFKPIAAQRDRSGALASNRVKSYQPTASTKPPYAYAEYMII